ncbi:MAG: hypothetical protein ACH34V_07010 [Flavobacterium sp.]|uniref:Uncharacterized protein n=1 Tax=Flavobacterium celericrescens TaxID=2709780 RepID=A0ABX0IBG4_9FLAO|nr:hypothetical protein [Flavobacterium celericrescens]NHM04515.1 hypothetical protein [Flavobacterium celericrescens]
MDKIIGLLIVLLSFFVIKLVFVNKKIKMLHQIKMQQLKDMITMLTQKQRNLNQKATISSNYQNQYKLDMKKLNDEIFLLQKRIFELLSKK